MGYNTTGYNNIAIGASSGAGTTGPSQITTQSSCIVIGNDTTSVNSNDMILGSSNNNLIIPGINQTAPTSGSTGTAGQIIFKSDSTTSTGTLYICDPSGNWWYSSNFTPL